MRREKSNNLGMILVIFGFECHFAVYICVFVKRVWSSSLCKIGQGAKDIT